MQELALLASKCKSLQVCEKEKHHTQVERHAIYLPRPGSVPVPALTLAQTRSVVDAGSGFFWNHCAFHSADARKVCSNLSSRDATAKLGQRKQNLGRDACLES